MRTALAVGLCVCCVSGSAFSGVWIFNSPSPNENSVARQNWLNAIGIDSPQYAEDFEGSFTHNQNISGITGLFPGGLVITDTSSAGRALVWADSIGGSNPIGSHALAQNEQPYLELYFAANPVDYVAFQDIDSFGIAGIVTFVDGRTERFSIETTAGGGNSAEFLGIFRNDSPPIARVQLNAGAGDGLWAIDTLEYGIVLDAGGTPTVEEYPWEITVPLQILRVTDDDGSRATPISPARVEEWVHTANAVYNPHGIQFTFDPSTCFSTIHSTLINNLDSKLINNLDGTISKNWDLARRTANQVAANFPGKMVVFTRWGPGSSPTGLSSFSSWTYDFIVMAGFHSSIHCGSTDVKLFAHEMGHHLGLPHTFGGVFETLAEAETDFAAKDNNPAVYDGDGFEDTPPHPSIRSHQCPPASDFLILNDVLFELPRTNIMSYYFEGNSISPQQAGRARWLASYYMKNDGHLPSNKTVSDVLEAETLQVIASDSSTVSTQSMSGFSRDGWSGDSQSLIDFDYGGSMVFRFSVVSSGWHQIVMCHALAPDFGIVQCEVNGIRIGSAIDGYASVVLPSGPVILGSAYLASGDHTFTIKCIGNNALSTGYKFGFDSLRLENEAVAVAPTLKHQPVSQTVEGGQTFTLSVGTDGSLPIGFQWQKDGIDIPEATNAYLQIADAIMEDSGNYAVTVTNSAGSLVSSDATVTVLPDVDGVVILEGETIGVEFRDDDVEFGLQEMSSFGAGWSGDLQLFITESSPGASIGLGIPVSHDSWFQLAISATEAPDYGIFECYLDGSALDIEIDGYDSHVGPTGEIDLGVHYLSSGPHSLELVCTGRNVQSNGYRFGVDYIILRWD